MSYYRLVLKLKKNVVGFLSDYKRNFLFVGDLENMAKHKEHKNF